MDKARKKNIKRIIALVCTVAVVALLAAMPLIAKQDQAEDGPKASILSGSVSTGSINTELIGGGTLAEEDAVTIEIPSAVKLTEFLVSNGQAVTEGTALASVDRVTVMTAITQVQETLEYLSEQIEEAGDTDSEETVTALAGGIVKILYAEEGDPAQSVMLEHGALAVLSLDGLMAVDLVTESALAVGTAVTVTLSDGTAATGKIARNLAGEMTVTVEDDSYPVGDAVAVTAEDGTALGSGELYIYSPWNATAYTGTVDSIKVSVGDKLSAGKALMVLSDVGYSAAYRQLIAQRQEYEDLMLDLFQMYQTETITAPCDGVVSGVDEESVQLLSSSGGFTLRLLANAPNGDDATHYTNYVAKVTAVGQNGWSLLVNPQPVSVTDYADLSGIPLDESTMTRITTYPQSVSGSREEESAPPEETLPTEETVPQEESMPAEDPLPPEESVPVDESLPPEETQPSQDVPPQQEQPPQEEPVVMAPVYERVNGSWQQISSASVSVGDILLFAADRSGEFVWIVRIRSAGNGQGNSNQPEGGFPSGGNMGGMSGAGSMGSMGGSFQGTIPQQESTFELYGLDMAQIAAVTPQDTMGLEITVDELDIGALQVGMTAQVKIDALGGEKYTATITEIGNTGTSNGGNSKYTVELTLDRTEIMLSGMNATAVIVLETAQDVLTVPADALVDQGNRTVIYTGYDEENDILLDPVAVTTGGSDGETVEILEGLNQGQTYYYAYYDTLEISFTPDFGAGGFMFG